ncbi:hypothetical protein MLD38_032472 [Melastoma candidum]|uniref:Uncharacterized protein n=1 Tax=Melastoma candidum TaxID=119954 RepID=A0ACB9M3Y3_9MYRT|nr:hypothetical protein MLD38_032472 [Melastoma candidum]
MAEYAKSRARDASIFWLQGFREACCLHRVVSLCLRSRNLLIRTGECFLLNGLIFLGSLLALKSVVIPVLEWLLPQNCSSFSSADLCAVSGVLRLYSFLHLTLIQLFYVLWFYPLYIFSLIISALWYGDIAKFGFAAIDGPGHMSEGHSSRRESVASAVGNSKAKPADLGRVVIGIGEQVYSILLLTFFFLEVSIIGYIPYIGKALSFLLLSWMYAYYCFEYKWNFSEVSLDKRLDFFQSNWAFFAGFGSPCVLAIFFFSPLVSYGVMAILFPLFVLTATSSKAEQVLLSDESKWGAVRLGRLPIFYVADTFSMWVLNLFSLGSRAENKTH